MVIDDTGPVEGIYVVIYCTKRRSGQVLPMPYGQTLKDKATQLLIKYKSGALVTQFSICRECLFIIIFAVLGIMTVKKNNILSGSN